MPGGKGAAHHIELVVEGVALTRPDEACKRAAIWSAKRSSTCQASNGLEEFTECTLPISLTCSRIFHS